MVLSTNQSQKRLERFGVPFCALVVLYLYYVIFQGIFGRSSNEAPRSWNLSTFLFYYVSFFVALFGTLFVYENVRGHCRLPPRRLSMTNDYFNFEPPKVEIMEAFHNDMSMSLYEKIKTFFFIVSGVAFARFLTFFFTMSLAMILFSYAGDREKTPRRFYFFSRSCLLFGNIALAAIGMYKVHLFGEEVVGRDKCKIIIANHSCAIEVILVWVMSHFPSFVSRRENLRFPFFSGVIKACDGVLVDRSSPASRNATQSVITEHARNPKTSQLVVFPEGTTGNQSTLFLFRKGAFEAGVPVQMICVCFPYRHFNPAWTGRAVGGNDMIDIAVRTCCQFFYHAEARVLPVYYPTEEEKADPVLYADHCQKMMACVLKENISEATIKYYKEAAAAYSRKKKEGKRR